MKIPKLKSGCDRKKIVTEMKKLGTKLAERTFPIKYESKLIYIRDNGLHDSANTHRVVIELQSKRALRR